MGIVNHHIIEEDRNQVTFLDCRYYTDELGDFYPSSTTVLDAYPKPYFFYEWLKTVGDRADEIRDAQGDKGSTVHKLTDLYDQGEEVSLRDINGEIKFKRSEWAMLEKYIEFSERFKPEILTTELSLVSPKLGYGGTIDRVMKLGGKTLLVDIKTGNSIYNHFWLQMASYVKLHEEIYPEVKIDGMAILYLNAKTRTEGKKGDIQGRGWQLIYPPKEFEHYWKLFMATHILWLEENEDAKPKNVSYQLTHKK